MKESVLHRQVCAYLKMQYPDVIFNTDLSGIKLTIGQSVQIKGLRSGRAFPDLVIYEPRNGRAGLFIELKAKNIYRKDGQLFNNTHILEQRDMLKALIKKGYDAEFAVGFDEAKKIIDNYLSNDPPHTPDFIIRNVAKKYGVTPRDIKSKTRKQPIAEARQLAMYNIRKESNLSLNEIGRMFGGKDHATVMHAIRVIKTRVELNQLLV